MKKSQQKDILLQRFSLEKTQKKVYDYGRKITRVIFGLRLKK